MKYGSALIFSILSFFTLSCGIIKPVTVKGISNFKTINSGTLPEFRFDISLYNPNNFRVKIQKLEVGVFVETLVLAKTMLLEETEITKKEASLVTVAMTPGQASLNDIFKTGINGLISGNINQQFRINGEIKIKKFIFKRRYNFSEAIKF